MSSIPEIIDITTEFIRLDALLKFAAAVESGGEAKLLIQDAQVKVNGEICIQRGKKIREGDTVSVNGEDFVVRGGV
ncbi:MAG: RNA-binding S4 domain-containing protein [Oscillospiraceae bacterium]|nr:RNA-binding S4 domain-containing protein [Oscillospiraceae bacterium]